MDLIEFLRARLDEDQAAAEVCPPWPWRFHADTDEVMAEDGIPVAEAFALSNNQLRATGEHIARWDPARVMAEVAAKRRVIEYAEATEDVGLPSECWALGRYMIRALAQPYADHPDFDPAWRLVPA